jgi:putative membrane protein insertion efficiency factor
MCGIDRSEVEGAGSGDDAARPIGYAARFLIAAVRGYQIVLGPVMGGHCKYAPTCSHYALEALREHGAVRGAWLSAWRVLRCNPFSAGGFDPVPPRDGS